MVPVCPGAHLCAPPAPVLVVDTGLPLDQGPQAPHVFSAAWVLISDSKSGPVVPSFSAPPAHLRLGERRATLVPRSPANQHLPCPGCATSGLSGGSSVAGPLSAGRVPARKSPASQGGLGQWLPESPTPSGSARQCPERAQRVSRALSGSPALQLRDAPGLGSLSVDKLQAPPEHQN
ncbi:hypothetical protein NDU88_001438 [Pleurodeles waltl]|uniref:Uncharacterized protein n=1 Tax=Pleurodeles waltl TaxID=8319 RepID=A0AAV7T002_PLEWA|nr:hypothetical protein NDU88_001438 [Pleurodeles waltl]